MKKCCHSVRMANKQMFSFSVKAIRELNYRFRQRMPSSGFAKTGTVNEYLNFSMREYINMLSLQLNDQEKFKG